MLGKEAAFPGRHHPTNELFRVQTPGSFQRIVPFWSKILLLWPCPAAFCPEAPHLLFRARLGTERRLARGKIHSLPGSYFWRWLFFLPRYIRYVWFFLEGMYIFPIRMMEDLWNIQNWFRNPANYTESMVLLRDCFLRPWDIHTSNLNLWKPSGFWNVIANLSAWKLGHWVLAFLRLVYGMGILWLEKGMLFDIHP